MLKHTSIARYPVPSAVVIKMFTDKKFHIAKLEASGLAGYEVLSHQFDGKEFSIKVERRVPMNAPGLVKKFFGAETKVVNEESWTVKTKTGRVQVQPAGVPVEMSCTSSMADEGGGCVITYLWQVNAKIPLVGGALEKFIVSDLEKRAAEETVLAIAQIKDYT